MERIPLKDVLYIIREAKNAVFYLQPASSRAHSPYREFRVRKTLGEIYTELNQNYFLFIDRGCIVNLHHIARIAGTVCELTDGTVLPVAQSRITELKRKLNEFWRNKI